jgi:hypothetical protein
MKEIQLTKGFVALVSDEDYEWLSELCKWSYANGYANNSTFGYMHILIMSMLQEIPQGSEVHHRSTFGLNNQRNNLVVLPRSFHHLERSGITGVSFHKNKMDGKPFEARICLNYRQRSLGYFSTQKEAAKVRAEAKQKLIEGDEA